MADGFGNYILGGRFLFVDFGHADPRVDRQSYSDGDKNRGRRGHRCLSHVHRFEERWDHRFGSGHLGKNRTNWKTRPADDPRRWYFSFFDLAKESIRFSRHDCDCNAIGVGSRIGGGAAESPELA